MLYFSYEYPKFAPPEDFFKDLNEKRERFAKIEFFKKRQAYFFLPERIPGFLR